MIDPLLWSIYLLTAAEKSVALRRKRLVEMLDRLRAQHQRVAQKRKAAVFRVQLHFARKNSATKYLYVKTFRDKVIRHSLAQLSAPK